MQQQRGGFQELICHCKEGPMIRTEDYSVSLTDFKPMFHFFTSWKHQKTRGFLTFSGGIQMERWLNIWVSWWNIYKGLFTVEKKCCPKNDSRQNFRLLIRVSYNPFRTTSLFLYPLKISENQRFSHFLGRHQWHEMVLKRFLKCFTVIFNIIK